MIIMFTDLLYTRGKASQVVQWVVSLPAGQGTPEIWVRFPGREDPLEEGTTTPFSIFAWREDRGAWHASSVHGVTESDMTEATEHTHSTEEKQNT